MRYFANGWAHNLGKHLFKNVKQCFNRSNQDFSSVPHQIGVLSFYFSLFENVHRVFPRKSIGYRTREDALEHTASSIPHSQMCQSVRVLSITAFSRARVCQPMVGREYMKLTSRVLGPSLIRSHCSIIHLLHTARFAHALCCAHLFARSLTRANANGKEICL